MTILALFHKKYGALIAEMLRFGAVGIVATLTHAVVALLVTAAFDLAPLFANLAGFSLAVILSFLGHLRITFRIQQPHTKHLFRFIALSLLSLGVSSSITALWTQNGGSMNMAMVLVVLIVPPCSYIAARFWAFDKVTK